MANQGRVQSGSPRNILAYVTLIFSALAITIIAGYAIAKNPANTMTIFNIVLPVFASWVGTILAFYFGRENFESANKQVREMVERLTPEKRAKAPINSVMRTKVSMVYFQISQGKDDKDVKISDLLSKFVDGVTRLPVINGDGKPKYMIHESSVNKYISSGGKADDTMDSFITNRRGAGFQFGVNKGFVVVSEETTLASAKHKMEEIPSCQDIFVTKGGTPDEPLTGWVSNLRLAKFLEA